MDNLKQNVEEKITNSNSNAKWYVVYVHSGCEKTVVNRLEEKIKKAHKEDLFEEMLIPTREVTEVKQGKKVLTEKKFFPGYVLIRMVMNNDTWHLVKGISLVSGFLGARSKPTPISEKDADNLLHRLENKEEEFVADITFEVGEHVKIIDGPFASFNGNVESVDEEKSRLSVSVSIFGRPTQVDLEFTQVEKI